MDSGFAGGAVGCRLDHLNPSVFVFTEGAEPDPCPLARAGAGGESEFDGAFLFTSCDLDRQLVVGFLGPQFIEDLIEVGDWFVPHGFEDIADEQASLGRGALGIDLRDDHFAVTVIADRSPQHIQRRGTFADVLAIDHRKDDIRILAIPIDTDASHLARGQAFREFSPGFAPIGGFVQSAPRTPLPDRVIAAVSLGNRNLATGPAVESVAQSFPCGDDQRLGIGRMHLHFDDAGSLIDIERAFPGFASVGGLVDAAFLVAAIQSPQRADVDDIGIGGVDDDFTDLKSLFQAHVHPGLASVDRLVHSIAVAYGVARIVFAGPDPKDIRVAPGDRHGADRHGCFAIELMRKRDARVGGLDQSTRCGGCPKGVWIRFIDGQVDDSAAHVGRSDPSPSNAFDPLRGYFARPW